MSWNYRIIYHPPSKQKIGKKEFEIEEYLAIHEAYYDEEGYVNSISMDGIIAGDEGDISLDSLKQILKEIEKALNKPVLNYDDLKNKLKSEKK